MNTDNVCFTETDKYINGLTDISAIRKAVLLKTISRNDEAFFLALQANADQLHLARQYSSRHANKKYDDIGVSASVLSRYVQNSTTTQ